MKENVFDVLMYLFENYLDSELGQGPDEDTLREELLQAGFPGAEVDKAFSWLEGLVAQQQSGHQSDDPFDYRSPLNAGSAIRVYNDREMERIDTDMRGFLLYLEQVGVLDAMTRELAIDRVMALESDEVDIDQLKWVVLMVLFNQPGREAAFAWMEDFVYNGAPDRLH
jgi:Smg protein